MTILQHYVSALLTPAIALLVLGLFVYFQNVKGAINRSFAIYTMSAFLWSFGEAMLVIAPNKAMAIFWNRICNFGIFFLATGFLHFVFNLLEITDTRKRQVIPCAYIFSLISTGLLFNKAFFLPDPIPKFSLNYFIYPGAIYFLFVIVWFLIIAYGLFHLFRAYYNSTGKRRNQLRYLCWGTLIGYIGGAPNYCLTFGIEIPFINPFFSYGVAIYAVMMTYSIARYKLMDIHLALRETLSFIIYTIVSLVIFLPLLILSRYSISLMITVAVLIVALSPVIFKIFPKYAREAVDKFVFRGKFGYLEKLSEVWEDSQGEQYTSHQIAHKLVNKIADIMDLKSASFFLYDNYRNSYRLFVEAGSEGMMPDFGAPYFTKQEEFIKYLLATKKSIIKEELLPTKYNGEIKKSLEKILASVVFPIFADDRLIGMLVLGPKVNGEMFHHEDIKILTKQIDIAQNHLSHTIFMEERASFSRKLSHDMKNLFSKGVEPTLQDYLEVTDEKEKQSALEALIDQFGFLKRCLRDNFDLTSILEKLVKQNYSLEPNSLSSIISMSASLYRSSYNEKGLSIEIDVSESLPNVLVNEEDMQKVFNNLLDNALKFTDQGKILIKAEQKEKEILITFSDTGLGIEKEDLENIFEPKVKMPDDERHGSGLGLTIVRDIVEAHKGRIWVESELGKGTSFYFTLPCGKIEK